MSSEVFWSDVHSRNHAYMNKITISFFALLSELAVASLCAQSVPPLVNYQGRLANPDGSPFPTADYELRFRIWDASTNGTLIWGPQTFDGEAGQGRGLRIPVVQGFFSVMLGPVDIDGRLLVGAFSSSNRFVEVTVSNRSPIMPRQQFLSVPFALKADSVATSVSNTFSPPGVIAAYMATNAPAGWLLCDGSAVSRTTYSVLFGVIGTSSGSGNGSTTFNLPDLRGMFLRGVDNVGLRDPNGGSRMMPAPGGNSGRNVGSIQDHQIEGHTHQAGGLRAGIYLVSGGVASRQGGPGFTGTVGLGTGAGNTGGSGAVPQSSEVFGTSGNLADRAPIAGGLETRPVNAYVNYIIKY